MDATSIGLLGVAGVAVVHTAAGPDHWLPFIMLARARGWSRSRTFAVTAACGLGHVASSLLLGIGGLALGYEIAHLAGIEAIRGDIAAWALLAFGLAYTTWGVRRALRRRHAIELHAHGDHVHVHRHAIHLHSHRHDHGWKQQQTTFWSLFLVFVLGPCEPLIPLFMVPLGEGRLAAAWTMAALFSAVTIVTMLVLVGVALAGMERLPLHGLERWSHALAGAVVATCGVAMLFGL
jgi:sulfite exporter TauE/SafE